VRRHATLNLFARCGSETKSISFSLRAERRTAQVASQATEKMNVPFSFLTDCISMETMRQEGITEILTHDAHFAQEGFTLLL
jgi:predicted nucleic acid-binding protein